MPEFHSMGDAINEFLKKSRIKSDVQALKLEDAWERIMGKTVSKYTDKIQIVQSTLFIHTAVAPLKQELMFQKDLIIQRVNEALGEKVIQEIVVR